MAQKSGSGGKRTGATNGNLRANGTAAPAANGKATSAANDAAVLEGETSNGQGKVATVTKPKRTRSRALEPTGAPAQPEVPPGPVSTEDLRIFQIYFEPWQRDLLEPGFVPLNNQGQPTEYLEFDLFERLSISNHVEGAKLWGALSWRFTEKTGLGGAELRRLIEANPDHDVYFCNPYPQHEGLYHNLWLQGETAHPRFLELVKAFFAAAGLPDETPLIVPSQLFSAANYFIGTPAFWQAYLPFVRGAIMRADANLPPEIKTTLHSAAADDRNIHAGQTYMPFIVERLFPLFMRTAGRELKGFKLPLTIPQEDLNVHQRLLREMKDMAWNTKSAWLAACWVNYRNLYLQQHHGQDWTQRFLRTVTPTEIRFA